MDKLLKLSFPSKEAWETVKESLVTEKGFKQGIKSIIELKHMQKPPAPDWQPDPNNPEDTGWTTYPDYAIDIVVEKDYDFSALEEYLISKPDGGFGHKITGFKGEIIWKEA